MKAITPVEGCAIKKPSKELLDEWNQKLKDSGFEDIEYAGGSLKRGSWKIPSCPDQDMILEFFRKLDHLLGTQKLPARDRKILELYVMGHYLKDIGPMAGVSQSTAQRVIRRYTKIINGYN